MRSGLRLGCSRTHVPCAGFHPLASAHAWRCIVASRRRLCTKFDRRRPTQPRAAQPLAPAEPVDAREYVFNPRARLRPAVMGALLRRRQRPLALCLVHHAVDQAVILATARRGRRAVGRVGVQRLAALGDVQ